MLSLIYTVLCRTTASFFSSFHERNSTLLARSRTGFPWFIERIPSSPPLCLPLPLATATATANCLWVKYSIFIFIEKCFSFYRSLGLSIDFYQALQFHSKMALWVGQERKIQIPKWPLFSNREANGQKFQPNLTRQAHNVTGKQKHSAR
jgi:hypothetical protein